MIHPFTRVSEQGYNRLHSPFFIQFDVSFALPLQKFKAHPLTSGFSRYFNFVYKAAAIFFAYICFTLTIL